jgi:hypothetical protein
MLMHLLKLNIFLFEILIYCRVIKSVCYMWLRFNMDQQFDDTAINQYFKEKNIQFEEDGIPITAPKNKAIDTIYSVSYNACNNCALSKSEPYSI